MTASREIILDAIRSSLKVPSNLPQIDEEADQRIRKSLQSITPRDAAGRLKQFAEELEKISGEFVPLGAETEIAGHIAGVMKENGYSELAFSGERAKSVARRLAELSPETGLVDGAEGNFEQRRDRIARIPVGLVEASWAAADVASLAVICDEVPSLLPHYLTECVFVLMNPKKLLANLFELFEKMTPSNGTNIVLVAGPSRTADIEKILILGAHGPKRLIVFPAEF